VIGKYNESNEIHTVVCEDNIVFTKGEGMRANANRAVYTVSESKIVLSEAPELARAGNILSADKITIFVDEDRSEAEGNVRVKVIQGENDQIKTPLSKGR
jgi:lipopolysaccharide export system protein LptA